MKVEIQRFKLFKSLLVKIHERIKTYEDLEEKLKEIGVHNGRGDRGILLDAHDLAIEDELQLKFVSANDDICDTFKEDILKILNLEDILDLRYWAF